MSIAWETSQFQRLCDRREMAALNCVGAIQFVLSNFEAADFERAERYLRDALSQYEAADRAINDFRNSLGTETKKENHANA